MTELLVEDRSLENRLAGKRRAEAVNGKGCDGEESHECRGGEPLPQVRTHRINDENLLHDRKHWSPNLR